MTLTIFTSDLSTRHDMGDGHPECPARIDVLDAVLADYPCIQSDPADLDHILMAHHEDYVFNLQDQTPDQGLFYLDGDTALGPHSYDAALHASGAAIQAVDHVLSDHSSERPPACGHDGFKRAFCATRPPGHHAEPNTAMGFCFFNHVFIAARHAQEQYGLKKIAIVDFDVHHGNGTDTMARQHNKAHPDQPILYISTHGTALFPMTGHPADNNETTLNFHLPDKCNSDAFRALYEQHIFPALKDFQPELLLISAGFDAHKDDPLAPAMIETADYGWVTKKLCEIAEPSAQGRIVSILEGGYNLEALKECVELHLQELNS